jgi:hypothetical protein
MLLPRSSDFQSLGLLSRSVKNDREPEPAPDDRPPICPACGVTQGMVMDGDKTEFVCLECGFSDADLEALTE